MRKKLSYWAHPVYAGVLLTILTAGAPADSVQNNSQSEIPSGRSMFVLPENRMAEGISVPPGNIQDANHQQDGRHEYEVIHLTDYLYGIPEIREAYQTYLEMKRERPGELQMMQIAETHQVGDTKNFNVLNYKESQDGSDVYEEIMFELRAVGTQSEIWVEQEEIAPDKINDEVVSAMMESLEENTPQRSLNPDQGVILNNIDLFATGNPELVPDPDGTGKVKVLVTNIEDEWDPDGDQGFVAGFFNPADLSPKTVNSNSNEAAILYIDTYPGIYTDSGSPDPDRPLSTVAHEFQHLIQAGKGNLITFMDEGQSEVAEIFNGFGARTMTFLDDPDELSGNVESNTAQGFLRWRRGESEVRMDYQRAQLFHSYLYERVGAQNLGSLTQSSDGNPWTQYQRMLNRSDEEPEFTDVLAEFYVTNWLNKDNHDRYSYSLPQLSSVRVSVPGRRFGSDERPWVKDESVTLRYGSARYTEWTHVDGIRLQLDSPSEIRHFVIAEDEEGAVEVIRMGDTELNLSGIYRSVILVSVNTVVISSNSPGSRQFFYTAEWTPDDLRVVEVDYSKSPADITGPTPVLGLPFESASNSVFKGVAVRVTPEYDGTMQGVDFHLWSEEDAVVGSGTLRVRVTGSRLASGSGADAINVPSGEHASLDIEFDELHPGVNSVDLSGFDIELEAGEDYHVFYQIIDESEDAELLFVFDNGSNDVSDENYHPVRTLIGAVDDDENVEGWSYLLGDEDNPDDNDNKNLVMTTRILSRVPLEEEFPEIAESDQFELLENYPNPFNHSTNIRFNIPDSIEGAAPVRLDVFDVTGRLVTRLMNTELRAGAYTVAFEPDNLSSGVYIVRLQAGDTVDSHKIMLLK